MPRDSPGTLVFWRQKLVDDPLPLKFVLRVTHTPFKQHNLDQYSLIAPHPWELANKVQLGLIGSRPHAFQRAIDEPCKLPLSPPQGDTKRDFAIFSVKIFSFPKISPERLYIKTSNLVHQISLERPKLGTSNLVCILIIASRPRSWSIESIENQPGRVDRKVID